jgi:hypothetical protein
MSERPTQLEQVLKRLGRVNGKQAVPSPHSYLTGHGLEALTGSDVARTAIPAASQLNAGLLDAAAGHVAVTGAVPSEYIYVTSGMILRSGSWQYESGYTTASAFRFEPNGTLTYWIIGPGDPNNGNNWHSKWSLDNQGDMWLAGAFTPTSLTVSGQISANTYLRAGAPFGAANANVPGVLQLGAITLQWGQGIISTAAPPGQTAMNVTFPDAVNATLAVVCTPITIDNSLVWIAAGGFGPTTFRLNVFRTNLFGGTLGPLTVDFSWLAIQRS